jgi:hypothetical protein
MFFTPIGIAADASNGANAELPPMMFRQNARMSCAAANLQLIPVIAMGMSSISRDYTTKPLAFFTPTDIAC